MNRRAKKALTSVKGEVREGVAPAALELAAIGLEAEFRLVVDGREVAPEKLFGSPQHFIRRKLVHREGTSYHLPTGGAVYFDTGVIEVATPAIEVDRGCAARAGRSLWESIRFVREELDAWETRTGRHAHLVGFSTHYNVSFRSVTGGGPARRVRGRPQGASHPRRHVSQVGASQRRAAAHDTHEGHNPSRRRSRSRHGAGGTVEELAYLLVHLLPIPVLLLAANRRSTGVGVRPRGTRVEVTVDFTPSPALMIATAAFITGVALEVMTWPQYDLERLQTGGIPVTHPLHPLPHTSRKGWMVRAESFAADPFATDVDEAIWSVDSSYFGSGDQKLLSLRDIAREIFYRFRESIRRMADPFTLRLLTSIFSGHAPVLMDLPDRPPAYEDVGRLCQWDDLFPEKMLCRSLYERVLIRAISGKQLVLNGVRYRPVGMRGWSEVVFERRPDGTRTRFPVDFLIRHLESWEAER